MAEHQIDPETVKLCIEALRTAPGVYRSRLLASDNYIDTISIDNAVVTLEGLLPEPEKTDAEKLVDEWLQRNGETSEVFINGYYSEHVSLVQFVLDRVSEKVAAAIRDSHALNDTYNPEPSYVYGPWIKWHGGECPVPGDWIVTARIRGEWEDFDADGNKFIDFSQADDGDDDSAEDWIWAHDHVFPGGDITHYRVRFEVGKWYDWTGGPCPVAGETRVQVRFYDGHQTGAYRAKSWSAGSEDWWKHEGRQGDNIVAFKVVPQ